MRRAAQQRQLLTRRWRRSAKKSSRVTQGRSTRSHPSAQSRVMYGNDIPPKRQRLVPGRTLNRKCRGAACCSRCKLLRGWAREQEQSFGNLALQPLHRCLAFKPTRANGIPPPRLSAPRRIHRRQRGANALRAARSIQGRLATGELSPTDAADRLERELAVVGPGHEDEAAVWKRTIHALRLLR